MELNEAYAYGGGVFGTPFRAIMLANWYGTGSGSDLAPCRQRLPSPPGRYRSLYRTVLRIRQWYPERSRATALKGCRHIIWLTAFNLNLRKVQLTLGREAWSQ